MRSSLVLWLPASARHYPLLQQSEDKVPIVSHSVALRKMAQSSSERY
jgi:hypothetical protein